MRRNLVDNAESASAQAQTRNFSEGTRMALPGLANLQLGEVLKRKAVGSSRAPSAQKSSASSPTQIETPSPDSLAAPQSAVEFRRPSLPASAMKAPQITSLARPVYPATNPITNRPASKSTSLPVPGPKPRAISPGLLQRMPSFESSKGSSSLAPMSPRKLNLRKASVDDLRRLYEERAGTAQTLVEVGKRK